MFYKIARASNWCFKLIAPFYVKNDFKYKATTPVWDFFLKKIVYQEVEECLFSSFTKKDELSEFMFGIGWSSYILYHYEKFLDSESKKLLISFIKGEPIQYNFNGLRPDQQDDINELLKLRHGVFQVYTGYGKTQIIAHLINYVVNVRKERLLLLAPSQKALNEVDSRVSKLFGITHKYIDYDADYNAINVNGFPRSSKFDKNNSYWDTVKWIIAEEGEYSKNDSGMEIIELCKNATRSYAFSATADKEKGERIRMRDGNIPVVQRNKDLIKYFGFALVYKKPENFVIYIKEVSTSIFEDGAKNFAEDSTYTEKIYSTFTDKRFCNGLLKIVQKEFPLYIPMERLEVIDHWIKNYFNIPGFVVINICGRGYELYIDGEHQGNLTLDEVKEYVEDDKVNLITGTSSSYRALDFPKLNKLLLLTSRLASIVIQAIGRVSRRGEFTIINLKPLTKLGIYTNNYYNRKKLISNYYSDCKIITTNKMELDYGIN